MKGFQVTSLASPDSVPFPFARLSKSPIYYFCSLDFTSQVLVRYGTSLEHSSWSFCSSSRPISSHFAFLSARFERRRGASADGPRNF